MAEAAWRWFQYCIALRDRLFRSSEGRPEHRRGGLGSSECCFSRLECPAYISYAGTWVQMDGDNDSDYVQLRSVFV